MKKITLFIIVFLFVFLCGCTPETTQTSQTPYEPSYELKMRTRIYSMNEDETKKLDLVFTKDGKAEDWSLLSFSSGNTSVATVNGEGFVTAVGQGTVTVTVSFEGKKVTANVVVSAKQHKIVLSAQSVGLILGDSKEIQATVYLGGKKQDGIEVLWNSSNTDAITVENGIVKAVGNGSATVTATYKNASESVLVTVVEELSSQQVNSFNNEFVNLYGRSSVENGNLKFDHASNAIELGIIGNSLTVNLTTTSNSYMRVWVDEIEQPDRINVKTSENKYVVAEGLSDGYHKVRIVKATEMQDALWSIISFEADGFATVTQKSNLKIEFVGDSISAGYGVIGAPGEGKTVENSDCTKSYTYFTAKNLNADYSVVAWSGICAKAYHWVKDINMATLYTKNSSRDNTKYSFDFNPDIIVLNLGTNEASYLDPGYGGSKYAEQFPADYKDMLLTIRNNNPNAYIICLYGMMGKNSLIENGIVSAIANVDDNKIVYNPFNIVANTSGANGHPSARAQEEWANQLVDYIKSMEM